MSALNEWDKAMEESWRLFHVKQVCRNRNGRGEGHVYHGRP